MRKLLAIIVVFCVVMSLCSFSVYGKDTVEIKQLRTSCTKTYDLYNGLYETQYYSTPVHYLDNCEYHDFDNRLIHLDNDYLVNKSSNYYLYSPISLYKNCFNFSYFDYRSFSLDFGFDNVSSLVDYLWYDDKEFTEEIFVTSYIMYQYEGQDINVLISSESTIFEFEMNKMMFEFMFAISSCDFYLHEMDGKMYLIDEIGVNYYEICKPYLINKNGDIYYLNLNLDIKDDYFLFNIDFSNVDFEEGMRYYLRLNNTLNCNYNYIRDKYVESGYSNYYDNNELLVGINPFGEFINGVMVYKECISFIELALPDVSTIVSASLSITKKVKINNLIYNPTIYLSQVTNKNYDEIIDGNTTYNTSYVGTGLYSSTLYTFDITSEVSNSLGTDYILFELTGTPYSGSAAIATFNSANSCSATPMFTIVTSDSISTTTYGLAPHYSSVTDLNVNCFGYALGEQSWISLINTPSLPYYNNNLANLVVGGTLTLQVFNNTMIPQAIYIMNYFGYDVRIINGLTSGIYSYERRIALKAGAIGQTYIDSHFMLELSDGTWAEKKGQDASVHHGSGQTPDDFTLWNPYGTIYDSDTVYFAIR